MVIISEFSSKTPSNIPSNNNLDHVKQKQCNESIQKIVNLKLRPGYVIKVENGQRIYKFVDTDKVPPRGCEVFIGKLFKHIYEDELIPLFEKIAPLYKFRMMMEFNQKSRGFAFATYFTPEDADMAVKQLHNHPIRSNLHIAVFHSVDNCRLFLGNIPKHVPAEEIMQTISSYVEGVKDVIVYEDYQVDNLHRGFAFVEFESQRLAAVARRQFSPHNLNVWGKCIRVDWANPLPEVPKYIMENVKVLYIRNVPLKYNSEELREIVSLLINRIEAIIKVHKQENYAFLHMVNRKFAEYALSKLNGAVIDDKRISVEWARPRQYRSKTVDEPTNLCRSVPLQKRRLVDKKLAELQTTHQRRVPFRQKLPFDTSISPSLELSSSLSVDGAALL